MAQKLITCLWLNNEAEEMIRFYKSVFKDNFKVGDKTYYASETPSNKPIGSLLTQEFEIFGNRFMALNGGPEFKFNEATSFIIECGDQEEVDYYWNTLSAHPENEVCGWLKDKFGVSWQISPKRLDEMLRSDDKDATKRAMDAMLMMKKIVIADLEKAFEG